MQESALIRPRVRGVIEVRGGFIGGPAYLPLVTAEKQCRGRRNHGFSGRRGHRLHMAAFIGKAFTVSGGYGESTSNAA
jgi:hypothetical protein